MVKKILYIGKEELKNSIIERTKNEKAYVFDVSCYTTARRLLTKISLDQLIVEYENENNQLKEFLNSIRTHRDFYKIPVIAFTDSSEGIKIVKPFE